MDYSGINSSDLWVTGQEPGGRIDTGVSLNLTYAAGSAPGNISVARLEFDEYVVEDQEFVYVPDASAMKFPPGIQGVIGLGPDISSDIVELDIEEGGSNPLRTHSVLSRIFSQNKTSQNFMSLLLTRTNDTEEDFEGEITISTLITGFENVTSMPRLPVVNASVLDARFQFAQHLTVATDPDPVVVNGHRIRSHSIVPHIDPGRMVATFDSGFTVPQIPREWADTIYGEIEGSFYLEVNNSWALPCNQSLNVTIGFGGHAYPIHPLDLNTKLLPPFDRDGVEYCFGLFQPIQPNALDALAGTADMILGMGFLRNVYALFDYGDFVDDSSNDRVEPYVQLLPITNLEEATIEFNNLRGVSAVPSAGYDGSDDNTTTGSDAITGIVAEPKSDKTTFIEGDLSDSTKKKVKKIARRTIYIIVGCVIAAVLLVGICICGCCYGMCGICRRDSSGRRRWGLKGQSMPSASSGGKYASVNNPKPWEQSY
ncbi:acid protease [Punctularia strigosozonata HHB-11173 SS5]|uniref:Acid protease n=1 Tax=Punctularia strigosozonata (strain HHB-11173) TaxID=741275 RepID=R7S1V5_PUNST|nr:acid protease [Punctularia strigosozonata HHB-11173 SS5]EIN04390.1 acid protease [Punctularia strigosozonata HHB-11173 SS5]